eukprot:TRINITY_DN13871_c0_g1_i1.p1 TRINITY_DN13871_c0_g1~~TRINITY_DN13871_c0_g1_i1.p1  ORF type:complete len:545 (-),score=64.49 TRINITY_DN13871_c0_g1_i1:1333-2967(-)
MAWNAPHPQARIFGSPEGLHGRTSRQAVSRIASLSPPAAAPERSAPSSSGSPFMFMLDMCGDDFSLPGAHGGMAPPGYRSAPVPPARTRSMDNNSSGRQGTSSEFFQQLQKAYDKAYRYEFSFKASDSSACKRITKLEMKVPLALAESFYRVLEALEFAAGLKFDLVKGHAKVQDGMLKLETEIERCGNPVPTKDGTDFQWWLNGWPCSSQVGKLFEDFKRRVPVLDSISRVKVTTLTVKGRDYIGALRDICDLLHRANFDIMGMSLRTQGPPEDAQFASVFYLRPTTQMRSEVLNAALAEIQKTLENKDKKGNEKKHLEVSFGERVATPEMWINWILSRQANPKPTLPLPEDVSLDFTPLPLHPHSMQMVLKCKYNPHVVFDTLCMLNFRGYKIVNGNFEVKVDDKSEVQVDDSKSATKWVTQTWCLETQSGLPIGTDDINDLEGHLALSFCRRDAPGERVAIAPADHPGLLKKVASFFHDKWYSVTRAEVELNEILVKNGSKTVAKTVVYATPSLPKCPPMAELRGELERLQMNRPASHWGT